MTESHTREKFIVPIGPQHPALKEPGHFEFTVDGEIVTGAIRPPGLCPPRDRKGAERAQLDPESVPVRTDLRHLLACPRHGLRPGRGKTGRSDRPAARPGHPRAGGELERIHSHLLWLGVAAHEGGFDTLFMYSWRDRETVMDLLEA